MKACMKVSFLTQPNIILFRILPLVKPFPMRSIPMFGEPCNLIILNFKMKLIDFNCFTSWKMVHGPCMNLLYSERNVCEVNIKIATSKEEQDKVFQIRKNVFVDEQHVPLAIEIDQHEDEAIHFRSEERRVGKEDT